MRACGKVKPIIISDLGSVYMTALRMNTETFVFVYIKAMQRLHQYVFAGDSARYCNY